MRVSRIVILVVLVLAVTALPASALDLEVDVKPPPGEVGTPYEFQFFGEEGCLPYRFSFLNGTLPPGLHITVDGKLTGTPTLAGSFSFWVALDDNGGPTNPFCLNPSVQSQGEFTMIVMPDLAVKTTSLPAATPGRPYSAQLEFTNPEAGWPVVWDITQGALPAGLTLSESGLISGTTAGADRKTFVVRAREPFRRFGEQQLTLTVAAALQGSSSLGAGEVGLRYSGSVSASGGVPPVAYSVAIGDLPAGLKLNESTGAIGGVPQDAGTFGLTFAVTDSVGQRTTIPSSVRVASRLAITTTRIPATRVGVAYRARLASTGGVTPKAWRISGGGLPRGVRLDASTGVLSGTARRAGAFRFTIEARDRLGARSVKTFRLIVGS
jgi:large repetitive protein